jgi:hypothetical protein
MSRAYRHLDVERVGDACCVRLRQMKLGESDLQEMGEDLLHLIEQEGCRKLVLSLGADTPQFRYSLFVAKLIAVRRRLLELGGAVPRLCEVSDPVLGVFDVCHVSHLFEFFPDPASALAGFGVETT